jgi:hypothetical protein
MLAAASVGYKQKEVTHNVGAGLISNASYRGQFEDRVRQVVKDVGEADVILFIDELHTLVGAGAAEVCGKRAQSSHSSSRADSLCWRGFFPAFAGCHGCFSNPEACSSSWRVTVCDAHIRGPA